MATAKKKTTKRTAKTNNEKFLSMRLTRQTAYWAILSIIVLGLAVWVLQLTIQIQSIYDRIEYLNATNGTSIQVR